MMSLEEMEKARKDFEIRKALKTTAPSFGDTLKHELEHVNWKLVVALAFGFLMWYAGTAIFENLVSTCNPATPSCEEP